MEKCHVSTSSGDEAKPAFEGLKDRVLRCQSFPNFIVAIPSEKNNLPDER